MPISEEAAAKANGWNATDSDQPTPVQPPPPPPTSSPPPAQLPARTIEVQPTTTHDQLRARNLQLSERMKRGERMMIGGRIGLGITGTFFLGGLLLLAISAGDAGTAEERRTGLGLTIIGGLGSAGTGALLGVGYREVKAAGRGELGLLANPRTGLAGLQWRRRF